MSKTMAQTFLYFLYTTALAGFSPDPNEYCDLGCPGKSHVMCEDGYAVSHIEPYACTNPGARSLTKVQVEHILNFHNNKRRYVANGYEQRGKNGSKPPAAILMPDLKWDNELAALAQQLANQCLQWNNYKCSHTKRFRVGQSVSHVSDRYASIDSLLDEWYNEVEHFNPKNVKNYKYDQATRRYAQMVAAKTTKIGCGYVTAAWNSYDKRMGKARFQAQTRFVCNYGPDGLVEGRPLYKVPENVEEFTTHYDVFHINRPN